MMGFEFPLLSDPEHELGRAMGVEREPDDRLYGIPRRTTFIVYPELVVRWSYRVPREETSTHADLALQTVRELMQ
jgi:peroxiredoxin